VTARRGFRTWLAGSKAAIALAWIFLATLPAQSQATPAPLMPSCAPADRSKSLPVDSLVSNSSHEPVQANAAVRVTSAVVEEVRKASFPELAHELAHVVSLNRGNRIRRLGLVRLLSKRYTAKFERRTDLEAIHRDYADGLESYRIWVYSHVPPEKLEEKHRNYFSPKEIVAVQKRLLEQPALFAYWSKQIPLNLSQIESPSN
jgi:hypothetical protein